MTGIKCSIHILSIVNYPDTLGGRTRLYKLGTRAKNLPESTLPSRVWASLCLTYPILDSFYSIFCFCQAVWVPPRLPSVRWAGKKHAGGLGDHAVRSRRCPESRFVDISCMLSRLSAAQRRLGKMRVELRTLAPSPPERPNVKNFRLVLFMLFMFNTSTLFIAQR